MCTGRGHIAHVDICMCVEVYMHRHGVDRVTHVDIYVCWGVYAQACEQKPAVNNGIDPQMPFISFFELGLSLKQGTHWFNLSWLPAVSVFCALGFTRVHHRDLLFKWVMGIELSSSCLPRRKYWSIFPATLLMLLTAAYLLFTFYTIWLISFPSPSSSLSSLYPLFSCITSWGIHFLNLQISKHHIS